MNWLINKETADLIMNLVSKLGFPIVVCFYLLFIRESTDKEQTATIRTLSDTMIKQTLILERLDRGQDRVLESLEANK